MNDDKLIRMANQIAAFQATQPRGQAAATAAHLNDFWTPEMRAALAGLAGARAGDLHPLVREAVALLRLPAD